MLHLYSTYFIHESHQFEQLESIAHLGNEKAYTTCQSFQLSLEATGVEMNVFLGHLDECLSFFTIDSPDFRWDGKLGSDDEYHFFRDVKQKCESAKTKLFSAVQILDEMERDKVKCGYEISMENAGLKIGHSKRTNIDKTLYRFLPWDKALKREAKAIRAWYSLLKGIMDNGREREVIVLMEAITPWLEILISHIEAAEYKSQSWMYSGNSSDCFDNNRSVLKMLAYNYALTGRKHKVA